MTTEKKARRHPPLRSWRLCAELISYFEKPAQNRPEILIKHPKTDDNPVSPPSKSADLVRAVKVSEMNLQKNASKQIQKNEMNVNT